MADYWGQLNDPASVYEGIYGEPLAAASSPGSLTYYGKGAGASINGSDPSNAYGSGYKAEARPASLANPTPLPSTGTTTYYPKSPGTEYGYNSSTGEYEVKQAGQGYTSVPGGRAASPSGGKSPAPSVANPLPRFDPISPMGGPSWPQFDDYVNNTDAFGPRSNSNPVHRHNVNVSDEMGQSFADGLGMAVVTPNGKTYKPKIEGSSIMPSGNVAQLRGGRNNVSGSLSGNDTRGPLSQMLGLKTSGLGGLLGGLFGGMQQRQALGQVLGMVPGVGSAVSAPSLGYNAAYAQSAGGDGQGNNGISESGGRYGGARSLTS